MNASPLLAALLCLGGCQAPPPPAPAPEPWQSLFDGAGLGAFAATAFGGEGEVAVRDGRLHLGQGSPLTGVHWTGPVQSGPLPTGDYELELVARRELGNDFFCGLTFPVGADHLTLVLGGWGGSVCGLSNLDGLDASRNATRTLRHFATGVDHRLHLRVQRGAIEVRVDDAVLLSIDPRQHRLALRPEVELCRPLGLCSYNTAASFAGLRWRPLGP